MGYSRQEMETTIVFDDEEKLAHIYTASPVSMRKLDKLCHDHPGTYKRVWIECQVDGKVTAARYEAPSKYIRFGKPPSEAQREAARRTAQNGGINRFRTPGR